MEETTQTYLGIPKMWSLVQLEPSKSHEVARTRTADFGENVHLRLCSALCVLQQWRGLSFHFNLEQPQGSELIYQHEMKPVLETTHRVLCDMCVAGTLRHPNSLELLRKRTQVWTTSSIMSARLEQLQCTGTHAHGLIAGTCWTPKGGRQSLSKYTENYTHVFARHLSRIIRCSLQVQEQHDHKVHDLCHVTGDNPSGEPEAKRRRLQTKSPAETLYEPLRKVDPRPLLEALLGQCEEIAPRVGKRIITEGTTFEAIQQVFPDMIIRAVDICKGVDRRRTIELDSNIGTHRWMFGRDRKHLQFFSDTSWEKWLQVSHRQRIRSTDHPARIAVTMFADPRPQPSSQDSGPTAKTDTRSRTQDPDPKGIDSTGDVSETASRDSSVKHGPLFRSLPSGLQSQLKRTHVNLGHPSGEQFARALADHGRPPAVQQAVRDVACDTCHELSQPKIARPRHLHEAREFNDLVQFDNGEWTDPNGKRYFFFHFVDTASNFHVAIPYVTKTTEGLIHCFQTAWLSWAGPPKALMFDSATEANSEGFAQFLQEHDIKSHVIPTDAHWQLGRAERHGAIIQNMLNKMYSDRPFSSQKEFESILVQITPEILVLGKSRRLPGSVVDETEHGSNITALQTEAAQFRDQLEIREAARRAFVRADNCSELRRALHGRSRPNRCLHQVGDWVMYWKNNRWQGPAKVLMVDVPSVLWLSHFIRCAPEHVRALSTREYGSLKSQDQSDKDDLRPGAGVFQYHQLTETPNSTTLSSSSASSRPSDPEGIVIPSAPPPSGPSIETNLEPGDVHTPDMTGIPNSVHSELQPDAEPENAPSVPSQAVSVGNPDELIDPSNVPIPIEEDDELVAQDQVEDFWEAREHCLIRHHVKPRLQLIVPSNCFRCPWPLKDLGTRITQG